MIMKLATIIIVENKDLSETVKAQQLPEFPRSSSLKPYV